VSVPISNAPRREGVSASGLRNPRQPIDDVDRTTDEDPVKPLDGVFEWVLWSVSTDIRVEYSPTGRHLGHRFPGLRGTGW